MFLTKEEAIKRGASEEFVNAKPIMCDTCLNGWVRISEKGYCAKCTLSSKKAVDMLIAKETRLIDKQSEGKWEKFEGERFICSNCAKVFGLGSTATIYDVKRVWKYCPNCGAKMEGSDG